MRWIVTLNVLAVLVNLGLNLVLIPRYGALGAAIGTTGTLVAHNVFKQVALRRATGLSFFRAHYLRIYGAIAVGFSLLLVTTRLLVDSLLVQIPLCAVVCGAVVAVCSSRLEVDETFPEVRRLLPLPWALRGRG